MFFQLGLVGQSWCGDHNADENAQSSTRFHGFISNRFQLAGFREDADCIAMGRGSCPIHRLPRTTTRHDDSEEPPQSVVCSTFGRAGQMLTLCRQHRSREKACQHLIATVPLMTASRFQPRQSVRL